MEASLAIIASAIQLALGVGTLLYLVFGLGGRFAVIEFQVGQLWRDHLRKRTGSGEGDDVAGPR